MQKRAKGIIADPMPESWYSYRACKISDDDSPSDIEKKEFNKKIVAANKPYFMQYVYPQLKTKLATYEKNNLSDMRTKFSEHRFKDISELRDHEDKTPAMKDFLRYYDSGKPIGENACVVNRICWLLENEFPSYAALAPEPTSFDYSILKCGVDYSISDFRKISELYQQYRMEVDNYRQRTRIYGFDDDDEYTQDDFINRFKIRAEEICPNENELCDIVLDICYQHESMKQFAWSVSADIIIRNLLNHNNGRITFPVHEGHDFEYAGEWFTMHTVELEGR